MAKRTNQKIDPDFSTEKALTLLRIQLDRLQVFKDQECRKVENEERQWRERTENIVVRAFGDPSRQISQFYRARNVGEYNIMGISTAQRQKNLDQRVQEFDLFLKNCIEELELDLPSGHKGVYEAGQQFQFFADLADFIGGATDEVFIIDPYLDEEHLSLYGRRVRDGVLFRVLTNVNRMKSAARASLESVGKKLKASHDDFEMRSSTNIHDRIVFIDDRAWVTGQSFKDAAKSKPTYIIELNDAVSFKKVYETIWTSSQVVTT